jgi:hypothetical protein
MAKVELSVYVELMQVESDKPMSHNDADEEAESEAYGASASNPHSLQKCEHCRYTYGYQFPTRYAHHYSRFSD